jgi:hypothetical protein
MRFFGRILKPLALAAPLYLASSDQLRRPFIFQSEIDRFNEKLREKFKRKIDLSDEFHKDVVIFSGNANE